MKVLIAFLLGGFIFYWVAIFDLANDYEELINCKKEIVKKDSIIHKLKHDLHNHK